ncbi:DUF5723 family protein [Psychroserpens mesophilus]|uniref:DUF5723 family protein n=1 Tax=Psychroserpens mesophilus TaxID=325473 RepID=UPI00058E0803|nr:DUF5723 family protein [Psychroserpens mesophilus]
MRFFKSLSLLLFILFYTTSHSQSYIGYTVDNYSGIHGVVYNPSNIVGSNFKTDVNIASFSGFIGSDYFGINFGDMINGNNFDFSEDTERFLSDSNNFFLNADVLGPSFMFNLNEKSSIGLVSRGRAFFNLNNINGELFEAIEDEFESENDITFDSQNLIGTVHAWAEIGIAYGRILMDKQQHILKGGVTLKYLQGAGALFASSPGFMGQYTRSTETLTTQGELNYGTSEDFDSDDLDLGNLTAGFGMDLGFTYQWHPSRENDSIPIYKDNYKLKVGMSITDIGSINYKGAEITSYNVNNTVDTSTYDELEEFLDNNYNNTKTIQDTKIQLPTALHLLVDYRIAKKWLVSAQANLSLVKKDNELANSIINTVTIAPRLETKWFSFYTPLSFRQYGDFAFGGGFRLGPLSIGSGSIFSNLLSDSSKTTDVFLGLKVPIYRK